MSNTHLVCTALLGTNKVGELKKDADGYYTVVLGALECHNYSGAYYPGGPAVEDVILNESGMLQRRIKSGNGRGEYGHPYRLPGQSVQEFLARGVKIMEDRVAFHVSEVWLDRDSVKTEDGKRVVAVMGKIKPCGPFGYVLEQQLQNPKENVCFSVRALTKDTVVNGVVVKVIRQIIIWDYVNEPGIQVASKWNSPALESIDETDVLITRAVVDSLQAIDEGAVGFSFESATVSLETIRELVYDVQKPNVLSGKRPASANW